MSSQIHSMGSILTLVVIDVAGSFGPLRELILVLSDALRMLTKDHELVFGTNGFGSAFLFVSIVRAHFGDDTEGFGSGDW